MTKILTRRWKILMLIILPLCISLACLTLTDDTTLDSQATEGAPADSQESEELIVKIDFGPGAFDFPNTKAGLADLSSYKATLTLSFDGTHDGQAEQWSKTYVMLSVKEPTARQLTIEKSGDNPDPEAVFMAEANGAAYERTGEDTCNATVIDSENVLAETWEPAGFLTGVIGADEAGAETVNDVAANHYTFDERAFGQLDIAQSTGEMWVASEGGYIVRYLLTTQGDADYFGEGIEGTLTWDYQLTDVNAPLAIELPADCPSGLVDAPLLPDASNVLNVPGVLAYDTASAVAEVAAFYQEQLPTLGWELQGEPAVTDTATVTTFALGDQQLNVLIFLAEAGAEVFLLDSSSGQVGAGGPPPAEEGAGGLEAFLLPDATNVENTQGILTFDTSMTPEEAVAFYEEQLPALGWQLQGEPTLIDTMALLTYTQGDQTIAIVITADGAGAKVQVVLE
jgi:hypothetical protein